MWINILPRSQWSPTIEGKRVRINRFAHQQMNRLPKGKVLDIELDGADPSVFRGDGIHRSDKGLDVCLEKIRRGLLAHY